MQNSSDSSTDSNQPAPETRRRFLARGLVLGAGVIAARGGGALFAPFGGGPSPARAQGGGPQTVPSDFRRGLGGKDSSKADFEAAPRIRVAAASRGERPARVLLTDYLPPVGDQGRQNSCVGWSTAYYVCTYGVAKQRKFTPEQLKDPKFQFSPAYVYHLGNGGINEGMPISRGFKILEERGCASLAEMPYSVEDFTSPPPDAANRRAVKVKARGLGYIYAEEPDIEKLKTYLAETRRPCALSIKVFTSFWLGGKTITPDFVYPGPATPDETLEGRHAICVVGYDDNLKAFRLLNSWGEDWGDKGFLWVSEDFIAKNSREAWSQVPGGAVARNFKKPIALTKHVTIEPPVKP